MYAYVSISTTIYTLKSIILLGKHYTGCFELMIYNLNGVNQNCYHGHQYVKATNKQYNCKSICIRTTAQLSIEKMQYLEKFPADHENEQDLNGQRG